MSTDQYCPCGLSASYSECCGRYIDEQRLPTSPEVLMRSRYTAYTLEKIDYIKETMKESALDQFDYAASLHWAQSAEWMSLEVVAAPLVAVDAKVGFVEFKAVYSINGMVKCLQENSRFKKINDRWYYVGSERCRMVDSEQHKSPRIGRNDPCPCGSGKKYKKCCYANSKA